MKKWVVVLGIIALPVLVLLLIVGINTFGNHGPGSSVSRVQMEIKGMEAALESYRAEHEQYPSDPAVTESLAPNTTGDPAAYVPSSEFLYRVLSDGLDGKRYYEFKSEMLRRSPDGHLYVVDPQGNSYGYSTFKAIHPESPDGNNPTFDLWSTGGHTRSEDRSLWARNW